MFPTVDTEDISRGTSLEPEQSVTSDEQDSGDSSPVAKQNNNNLFLNMLVKETIFCIALAVTTYGALHNIPASTSKVPHAVRFFNTNLVKDWYKGQLSNALALINKEDISFVMYYAPWDAESQYVRGEFEATASVLNDRVHFSAINCWNPGSECRLQHNKIPSWPILMVYTVTSRGILYKGPRNAESMVNFLELIMKPLQRVSSTEDLVNLLSMCDAVAVGYTPVSYTSKYYNIWYNTAIKTKEFDTIGEVCFAVVTSTELAVDLGIDSVPNARFMLWNDTKDYTPDGENQAWNESSLVPWILENFVQPVSRIIPMWRKGFNFERFADGSPMLILFTPMNPLYEQLPSYALMREVAMEYYNCKNNETNQWTMELMKLQQIQRLLYQQKNFLKFCQEHKFKPIKKLHSKYKKVVSHNNKYPWNNVTEKNQKNSAINMIKQGLAVSKIIGSANENEFMPNDFIQACGLESLAAEKNYENYEQCLTFEEHFEDFEQEEIEMTILPSEDDPLSPENLVQENIKHACNILRFANKLYPAVNPGKVDGNISHIHGLACQTNLTMNILAVDSLRNYHFAEALGIDLKNKKDMTAVVILDSKHESQYVLSGEYNAKSVREFIANFTRMQLKRTLRTHVEDAAHTHYFGSNGSATKEIDFDIINLTTRSFRRTIRMPGVLSLVAVCGGACSGHTTRALSEAARLLNECGVRTQAARIDALRHDLPWHYTPSAYPTILVFSPHRNGEDSRAYPRDARISSSGLVALSLRALPTPLHLRVRLVLCARIRAITEKKACLKDMRENVVSVIGRNLKYWRQTQIYELKKSLLKRLQNLNQAYLFLSLLHTSDLKENNCKRNFALKSFDDLSTNWYIDTSSILRKNGSLSPIIR
ncbi:thioredoxin domain-containing protein 11 [Pieris napi]|uniref:thioredoxin domain-containing protein 11 n=1 Tax=Pieris napi TaxID=78633 RepID=UPI001FB8E650|nr:thioredoxin domain-containing protein 11 [Pieris napi]XP_047516742.1 thioredoxin domain-containing protein 11 [Pieris napi]XP_047516743.1 thioredoxin domain-containing protein 11 [Pieris napi]